MKRTTVVLPDQLAALLDAERRRRDVSAATIIREAIERYLTAPRESRKLKIAALGSSGRTDTSERMEEILAAEWGGERGYQRIVLGEEIESDDDASDSSSEGDAAPTEAQVIAGTRRSA